MLCQISLSGQIPDSITFCVLFGVFKNLFWLNLKLQYYIRFKVLSFSIFQSQCPRIHRENFSPPSLLGFQLFQCIRRKEIERVKCLSLNRWSCRSLTVDCCSFSGHHWQMSKCQFSYGNTCEYFEVPLRASLLQFLNMRDSFPPFLVHLQWYALKPPAAGIPLPVGSLLGWDTSKMSQAMFYGI